MLLGWTIVELRDADRNLDSLTLQVYALNQKLDEMEDTADYNQQLLEQQTVVAGQTLVALAELRGLTEDKLLAAVQDVSDQLAGLRTELNLLQEDVTIQGIVNSEWLIAIGNQFGHTASPITR